MLDIQREVASWVTFALPDATFVSHTQKLRDELQEFEANPSSTDELADIGIVLLALMSRMGVDFDSALRQKMEVNRRRSWHRKGDGTYQHDKTTPTDADVETARRILDE